VWSERSSNIKKLQKWQIPVYGGVDATQLAETLPPDLAAIRWRAIIFTFPIFHSWWDCEADPGEFYRKNQQYMAATLRSARSALRQDGELHFVLVERQLRQWKVLEAARGAGLALCAAPTPWLPELVGDGYAPMDENGQTSWFNHEDGAKGSGAILTRFVLQGHPRALPLNIPRAQIEAWARGEEEPFIPWQEEGISWAQDPASPEKVRPHADAYSWKVKSGKGDKNGKGGMKWRPKSSQNGEHTNGTSNEVESQNGHWEAATTNGKHTNGHKPEASQKPQKYGMLLARPSPRFLQDYLPPGRTPAEGQTHRPARRQSAPVRKGATEA
jgi:hypothetical protein